HKRGSLFDLAIVMAAWGADYAVQQETGPVFLAALGLDGSLQSAPGILPAVIAAVEAGFTDIVVAKASESQAKLVPGATVHAYRHVNQVTHADGTPVYPSPHQSPPSAPVYSRDPPDHVGYFAELHGQHEPRCALESAAAGGHIRLRHRPPGAGKTMLAQRL